MGTAGTAVPTPSVAFCEIRQLLLQSVADAVSELVAIQNEHLRAIISGAPDFAGFEDRLRNAAALKDERKRAFLAHVKEHGC